MIATNIAPHNNEAIFVIQIAQARSSGSALVAMRLSFLPMNF